MRDREPPNGYARFVVGKTRVVCLESLRDSLHVALRDGTLYDFAARQPAVRALAGRGASYAITLPNTAERVVVRHNRHGGLFAPITGDLFLSPTRAPLELEISERLRAAGVPTPRLLAYVAYVATPGFERVDVVTREVENAHDLSASLMSDDDERERALFATARLIRQLADADARHHDLNIKNVLLEPHPNRTIPNAFVLDVDRVTFGAGRDTSRNANLSRLLRSARKWQSLHGARVTDAELDAFASAVRSASSV
jgi:hypothetical protein